MHDPVEALADKSFTQLFLGRKPHFISIRSVVQVLRGMSFAADREEDIEKHPELLKPEVRWNVGIGHAAVAEDSKIEAARTAHTQLFESVEEFFATHDMLVTPTVIVQPYDIDL